MAYTIATSSCFGCKNIFTFNPKFVPSINNQAICKNCIETANKVRKENKMDELKIHPEAYKPQKEDA